VAVKKTQSSKKASAKKPGAKKPPAPKAAVKEAPAKKVVPKKAVVKKAPGKKPAASKPVAAKSPAAKSPAKKSAPKVAAPAPKAKATPAPKAKAAPAPKVKAAPAPAPKVKAAPAPAPKVKAGPKKAAKAGEKAKASERSAKTGPARSMSGAVFGQAKDVRILVVDDEPEVLELLVPFLRGKGYTVSEAQDGDQALEKILTERPNIVVLDVMMPGLSGWEISRYVRERAELDPVRIIMATGIGKETNAATSPLYGADAYLDKPFRLDALDRTVTEVIKRIESTAF
jgi:CheY-like chemotaxis protein